MFDFHLGDGLTIPNTNIQSPLIVLGKPGQGKTVFLLQCVLELIKHNKTGILYDPYGDLANDVQKYVVSENAKAHCVFLTQEKFLAEDQAVDPATFMIISGNLLEEGGVATREISQQVIMKASAQLTSESWLVIDNAFAMVNEALFAQYTKKQSSPQLVLSDMTMINLSAKQRAQLFAITHQYVIYNIQKIDSRWIEELVGTPTAQEIFALPLYYFYWINQGKAKYIKAVWPVQSI